MSEVEKRIIGTEMEWPIAVQNYPGEPFKQLDEERAKLLLGKYRPDNILMVGQMVQNGARYYLDVGTHLEYATPEDDWLLGCVANEIAGEQILYSSLVKARNDKLFHDFRLNKRVVDQQGHTWGYHNSYNARAGAMEIDKEHLALVGLRIATGNLFFGAGAIVDDAAGKPQFWIAQKVVNLNCDFATSSHMAEQPLVSLRNESLANNDKYRRVHITCVDPNMSPWATWFRLGSMSITLRLIEQGYRGADLMPNMALYKYAKQVARDVTMQQTVELAEGGKHVRALDIEHALLERADKLDLPDEEATVREEWKLAHAAAEQGIRVLASRKVDWAIKRVMLDSYMEKHEQELGHTDVRGKDRLYDDLSSKGIGQALRAGRWAEDMPSKRQQRRARNHAPRTTRASIREQAVRAIVADHAKGGDKGSVGWNYVSWPDGKHQSLNEPHLRYRAA